MITTILVPLDTSSFGEQALPLARTIAAHSPPDPAPTLHLVHVHVPVYGAGMGDPAMGGMPILDDHLDAAARHSEAQYLEALSTQLHQTTGLHGMGVVLDGPVAAAVAEHAAAIHADLIVLTTHGRGGMARMWLGSVADTLLRHGGVPVVVVRPLDTPPLLEPGAPITRILIPLDGSALAEQVLDPACALGDRVGASYLLLHVFPAFPVSGYASGVDAATLTQMEQRARADMEDYLTTVAARLRAAGRVVDTAVCSDEQPASAILETARQRGADLIAVTTHGRSGVRRWLLGSMADKVVRAAHTPVLVYHPQENGTA